MDIIEIDNLRLRCVIGFSQHERKDRQDVVISLRLGCDMRAAARSDDPKDALNYRSLTKDVITLVEASRWQLLETLATAIARICLQDHRPPGCRCERTSLARCASRIPWASA